MSSTNAVCDEPVPPKRIILIGLAVGLAAGIGITLFFTGMEIAVHYVMSTFAGYSMPFEGTAEAEIAAWSPPSAVWLILPVIIGGALLSALIVRAFCPESAGHGTDAAIKAYHTNGNIRARVPLVKAVSSIITISTGGSAGGEGPTAQISAGLGCIIADALGLSPRERRIAIAAGIGAGIGTFFKAPLGGAILASEILYRRDLEYDTLLPSFIASMVGYGIFGFFYGYGSVFAAGQFIWNAYQLPAFILLGITSAVVGYCYVKVFYGTNTLFFMNFKKHGLPSWLQPVTGAAIIGLIVVCLSYISADTFTAALASLGTGYGFVQLMIYNMLPLSVLLLIPVLKIFTTALTIGTGGSGGVFAPGLTIGASAGAALGMGLHVIAPSYIPLETVPCFAVIGMLAMFGGISGAPCAMLLMVIEMTDSYTLLLPAMGAVAAASILCRDVAIFHEQVPTRRYSRAHAEEYPDSCPAERQ